MKESKTDDNIKQDDNEHPYKPMHKLSTQSSLQWLDSAQAERLALQKKDKKQSLITFLQKYIYLNIYKYLKRKEEEKQNLHA